MARLARLLATGGLAALIVLGWAAAPIDPGPPLTVRAPENATPRGGRRRGDAPPAAGDAGGGPGRSGFGRAEAREVIALLRGAVDMRRLAAGRAARRLAGPRRRPRRGGLLALARRALRAHAARRRAGSSRAVRVPVDTRIVAVAGRLTDSLFASMERLGEGPALTAAVVGLFEWDFDFAADSLPGDHFRLLVEKRYADGDFLGYGEILVAQYRSSGRAPLTGVGFADGNGRTAYYDGAGRSVRKMFLRAPLDFTRITSGFSHARTHPILGGTRPASRRRLRRPGGDAGAGGVGRHRADGGLAGRQRHQRDGAPRPRLRDDVQPPLGGAGPGGRARAPAPGHRPRGRHRAGHRPPPRLPREEGRSLGQSARREIHSGRAGAGAPPGAFERHLEALLASDSTAKRRWGRTASVLTSR